MRSIQLSEMMSITNQTDPNAKEAWAEMIVRIDNHMLTPESRKILVRCETNIFNLYRGAAEAELKISDDTVWMHGGKVSPTTDQRRNGGASTKNGDPDNSALQAGAVQLFRYRFNTSYVLLHVIVSFVVTWILS